MPRTAVLGFAVFLCIRGYIANVCKVGQYQKDAVCKECKTTCTKCISGYHCTECKAGFFGEACTYNCSESCFDKICVKETGDCLSCNKGYYVNEICDKCPEKCQECKNQDECTHCQTGYTGSICENPCVNCKPDSGCSLLGGICNDGCKDGYTGLTCLQHCFSNCLSCDRVDAEKCIACANGKYGKNCKKACPTKCISNVCSKDTGTCTHGCQNGFWGDHCEYVCPVNCRGGICFKSGGHCSNGCNGTFTGTKCFCPKTCDCDDDGACTKCDDNTDYVCDKQCRTMCLKKICSFNIERKCFYGCNDRYKGSLCIPGTTEAEVKIPAWKIVVPIFVISAVIVLSCIVLSVLIKTRSLICRRRNLRRDSLENGTTVKD